MSRIYKVIVIGAGKIGALFDKPETRQILTHAHAFSDHSKFDLVGFVDTNFEASKKAAETWGGRAYKDLKEAFEKEKIDIVSLATPDETHYALLKKLSGYPLDGIFAEKPLVGKKKEADEIIRIYNKCKIAVTINYPRRFVPEFIKLAEEIKSNIYGSFSGGYGVYGKGFLHNGSHLVDLLRLLIGEIKEVHPVRKICDFSKTDPSYSGIISFRNKANFFFQAVDQRKYTIFELDLLFAKSRIRIINSGFNIEKYEIKNSELFSNYKNLTKTSSIKTSFDRAMLFGVDNFYNSLGRNKISLSPLSSAYKTLKTCFKIQESKSYG